MNIAEKLPVLMTDSNVVPQQSPDRLIALAIEQGADVDKLEKLMQLQERWNANQARSAFYAALSQFQMNCPVITKSKSGYDDRYRYAPLDKITEAIKGVMNACGLTYRWEQAEEADKITVTCIINHIQGHAESTSLTGSPDTSGSKNAIQSRGSVVQYLRRYTLESALGISTSMSDNDGGKPVEMLDENQVANLTALMEEVGANKGQFLKYLKVEKLENLPKADYGKAVAALEKKRK